MTKVIHYRNLPARPPFYFTLLIWLFLREFGASDLMYGIIFTLVGFAWVIWLFAIFNQEQVDIFKESKE